MSINAEKFPNTGESVQVGGMSGGLTATTFIVPRTAFAITAAKA